MPEKPVQTVTLDPNTFFGHMFAGLAASSFPPSSWDSHARNAWFAARARIEWAIRGDDVKELEAIRAAEAERARLQVEREEREAREEAERLDRLRAEHGQRATERQSPVAAK